MRESTCRCGNAARYVDADGQMTCGICPIRRGVDSIKIASVPALLAWARGFLRGGKADHQSLREIIGRAPEQAGSIGVLKGLEGPDRSERDLVTLVFACWALGGDPKLPDNIKMSSALEQIEKRGAFPDWAIVRLRQHAENRVWYTSVLRGIAFDMLLVRSGTNDRVTITIEEARRALSRLDVGLGFAATWGEIMHKIACSPAGTPGEDS